MKKFFNLFNSKCKPKTYKTAKTKEKSKKNIEELDIAIKTTDIHKEGLDIIDFLCKTYNVSSEKYQNVDEYKTTVLQNTDKDGCYWIIFGEIWFKRDICVMPAYYFSKKFDDIVWFDNFSEFKKYIEDVKDENIT